MRYLLFRILQAFETALLAIPGRFLRESILRLFYDMFYSLTVGAESVMFFDGTSAKFYRCLMLSRAIPTGGEEVRQYVARYDLKEGDVVIDAGAWPGDFSIYAAMKVGQNGRVICFEPNPYNRRFLLKNIRLNHLENIVVLDQAVSKCPGNLRMSVNGKRSKLQTSDVSGHNLCVDVSVTTIDNELRRMDIENVDFIKMDIESAEVDAVQGCLEIMHRSPVSFAISSHHRLADGTLTWKELERFFVSEGYSVATEDGRMTYAFPSKK